MLLFKTNSTNKRILQAIESANDNASKIVNWIEGQPSFLWATCTGLEIGKGVKEFYFQGLTMTVKTYKPWWPWSKALGYFKPSEPHTIYLNSRKLNRSRGSITSSLWHELIHAIDNQDLSHEFGHKDNTWTPEKEETAPYKIDNFVHELIDNKKTTEDQKKENSFIYSK